MTYEEYSRLSNYEKTRYDLSGEAIPSKLLEDEYYTSGRGAEAVKAKLDADPFVIAAREQSAGDKDVALTQGALNRVGEVGPTGNLTWSLKPGADANNPQPGDWISTTSLNEGQQGLYDASVARQGQFGDTASNLLTQFQDASSNPFDRKSVEDALYGSMTRNYGDRFARDEESIRDRLVNQGLDENSAAFKTQISDFTNNKNDAYAEAGRQSTLLGGDEALKYSSLLQGGLATIGNLNSMANPAGAQFSAPQPIGNWQSPDLLGAQNLRTQVDQSNASANAAKSNSNKQLAGTIIAGGLMAF